MKDTYLTCAYVHQVVICIRYVPIFMNQISNLFDILLKCDDEIY
jgi:hypothetical protein